VGEQVGAVAVENMEDQHLGVQASLFDCGGFELGDGRVERLAELHESIVRRRARRSIES
jgi:hypothetical protein